MKMALIENNLPVCHCDETRKHKMKIIDVGVVSYKGERYFEVVVRCNTCNDNLYYLLDLSMENRFSADRKDESYIKVFEI